MSELDYQRTILKLEVSNGNVKVTIEKFTSKMLALVTNQFFSVLLIKLMSKKWRSDEVSGLRYRYQY